MKWEYFIEWVTRISTTQWEDLGGEEWELVTIYEGKAYFKRLVNDQRIDDDF